MIRMLLSTLQPDSKAAGGSQIVFRAILMACISQIKSRTEWASCGALLEATTIL